jgi:hypothetical protein
VAGKKWVTVCARPQESRDFEGGGGANRVWRVLSCDMHNARIFVSMRVFRSSQLVRGKCHSCDSFVGVVVCRNGPPFLWICPPMGAVVLSPYKNEQEVKLGQSVRKVKAHTAV